MKKIIFASFILCSLSFGIGFGSFELSPEAGTGAQQINEGGEKRYYWNAFARVWVGADNIVFAPSFRYTQMNNSYTEFSNTQYGLNLGYTLDLIALYATPYVGLHYSHFTAYYDNTLSFNAGMRVKPIILPFSLGLEYEWQKPKDMFGNKKSINGIRFSVGLSL